MFSFFLSFFLSFSLSFSLFAASISAQQPPRRVVPFRPPEQAPKGPHNARKLLRETALVKVHLGGITELPLCAPTIADVVLVFKANDQFRIANDEAYWKVVDDVVVPAVTAECGGARTIRIENYVEGYRLAPVGAGAPRVYAPGEPFMTKQEQSPGFTGIGAGEAVEVPLNRASRTVGATGAMGRSFSIHERDARLPAPASIADARAELVRYTSLVARLETDRLDEDARRRAAALATTLDLNRWSYRHGQGFILSDSMRRRQAEAARLVQGTDPITAALKAMESILAPQPPDPNQPIDVLSAGFVVGVTQFIRDAERVLATLPGWTPRRLQTSTALPPPLAANAFLRTVFAGEFAPWLGQESAGPTLPVIQPRRKADLTNGFLAYHVAYARACAADRSLPWTEVSYSVDFVQFWERSGIEFGRIPGEKTYYRVRDPYADMFVVQVKRWSDQPAPARPGELPSPAYEATRDDLVRWLGASGCASDVARQLEVNLFLASQGFPSLQTIFQNPPQ